MGNSVSFFGFSSEPDVTKLDKLAWLRGWTLFSEAEVPAWYLEGPNATSEITFFEPLRTEKFAPDTNILTLAQTITSKIEEALGYTTLFRVDQFFQCAALSKVLGQTAICVLGDDEGLDSCFVFDRGTLTSAKIEIDWDKALIVNNAGAPELERLYPVGSDADDENLQPRMLHQLATEQAKKYFGCRFRWTISADPVDAELGKRSFKLVGKKGSALKPPKELKRILEERLGANPKRRALISALAPIVETAMRPEFINEETQIRFDLDEQIGQCLAYVYGPPWDRKMNRNNFEQELLSFLTDLGSYTRPLRPKPEFRKNPDLLPRRRESLSSRWMRLKLETNFPLF